MAARPVTAAAPLVVRPALAGRLLRVAARRAVFALPVLLLVSAGIFVLGRASPFDPVAAYFGVRILRASPEQLAQVRRQWGVDDPASVQYLHWLGRLLHGDLGDSRLFQQPVTTVIGDRWGWSALLVGTALALALLVSVIAGTLAAWARGGWFDRITTTLAYVLEAAPVFWLALGALSLFAVRLQWLPAGGLTDARAQTGPAQVGGHLLLPGLVLAVSQTPWLALFIRQSVLDALSQDHVTGARSRGLTERSVVLRHALRTALLPFVTLIGARVPELITGALLVETVFSWPGIASATVNAAVSVDFPLLAALTMLATVAVLAGNLAADLLHLVIDPRINVDG